MKLFLTLILFLSTGARASTGLLMCLGAEEKRLHQEKDTGPFYDLNQRMTAEMVQIPDVTLNPADHKAVCDLKNFSQSWKLLELSLKKGKSLFVIPASITGLQRSITQGMIDDYSETSREILLNFISQIQALSPTPNCLFEEIPKLNQFFIEIKYLQEDVDIKKIMAGKDEKIFEQFKGFRKAFQRCNARVKKKAKSKSVAPAKKP
ncbi:MAG: hypothetical protein V4598_18905 [Bdellovibrionota bacterium]